MIHVCLSLHDKNGTYSKFTGTTILSVFENTNLPVTIHILHDKTLTADNREKFIYIAGRYSQAVKFYNVEKLCAEKISEMLRLIPFAKNSTLTVGALYRLLLPQILSSDIEKIIYLDSDIVVNMNINELWQLDLGGKIFAAVPDSSNGIPVSVPLCRKGYVAGEDYFNSGVMLIDLKIFRREEKTLARGVEFCGKSSEFSLLDQDVLNYLFSKNYFKLPVEFNSLVKAQRFYKIKLSFGKIYHYTATALGFGLTLDMSDPFNALWMKYFVKTPWFNEKTIARLYENFFQVQAALKKSALKLSASMTGKERVFIVAKSELDALLENFSVREDEEIFAVDGAISIQRIINAMNSFRSQKIFFFLLSNFPFDDLEKAGFVRDRDFIDGFDFSPKNFNSYPLVAAL